MITSTKYYKTHAFNRSRAEFQIDEETLDFAIVEIEKIFRLSPLFERAEKIRRKINLRKMENKDGYFFVPSFSFVALWNVTSL